MMGIGWGEEVCGLEWCYEKNLIWFIHFFKYNFVLHCLDTFVLYGSIYHA